MQSFKGASFVSLLVPYIKPSLKPIRPKPQILTESEDKYSLALVSSSLGQIDLPQNSCHISHVQKETLFNCSEKNTSVPYAIISKCQKLPNFTKYESCVKDELSSKCDGNNITSGSDLQQALFIPNISKIDIPKKINTSNLVKPYIINLGHTIDANFKEVKHDKNKSSAVNDTSSCTKQQFHSLAQHRPTVNECMDNCNNTFKQNSNLLSEKLGETKEKISLAENNLKLALIKAKPKFCKEFFDKRLNIVLTENFENDSENTLKRKESAILKTFAKIAPCSPEYTNKARNFFTIKRSGKRSLVVCRNAKERQLQFLPTIHCNNDRCCPNLLNEFSIHKHSVLNILQDKIVKSKSSKCKNALFLNSLNDNYDGNIDNHIPSTQLNSDLEIINKIKETQDKNNLEIIAGDLTAEINHADEKTGAKQLLNFPEDDFDSNLLNENKCLKHVIPATVTECSFSRYKRIRLGKKTTSKIGIDDPIVKETSENANCSLIKITVTKEQRAKNELDLPVTNTKFDLWTNSTISCHAKEILQKYRRIAPHLNDMQNKSQSSLDVRSEKNTSKCSGTLLENQKKYLSVFKRVINGNIKSKEENLSFSNKKCDLEIIGQEKNSKRLKVSCKAYCKEGVPSRRIKYFSQHLLLKNDKDSKQQESGGSCNNSQCAREVKITQSCCAAENNCCSTAITSFPKISDRCVPLHSSNPTDNIDMKLLTFTELTDLSQKLGEKIFHSLSLDEITEKAILEWTESGISTSINPSSTNSSNFINLTDCHSEMITSNCCISDSSLQRSTESTPLYLNLNEMAKFQKQQLNDINSDVSNYVLDKQNNKNNIQSAMEDEFDCSNLLFEENIPSINNIGKTDFLNCLNLHRSDNVFGISVLFPRILQKIEPDYIENPCVPLHRIIKSFKSLKQYHTKLRNFSKTEHLTPTVATPLSTDFCNEKTLLSTHNMNEVKPVSKSVKRKCVVIPSDSRHKTACLLIPVQTMLPSSGSSTSNIETSTQCKPCIAHNGSFTKFMPIEKPAMSMRKTSTLSFSSLPKSFVIKHRTLPHVICAKQTNLAHSKRTAQRNSTILRSQKTTVGDTLKIPSVSVITHCCTSSHHSNFCCNVNNRYHRVTKLV